MKMDDAELVKLAGDWVRSATVCDMTIPFTGMPGSVTRRDGLVERFQKSGFDFVSLTCASDPDDLKEGMSKVASVRAFITKHADSTMLVLKADDIEKSRDTNRLAIGLHFQGSTPFGRNLDLVESFYQLGVRHALMAYNQANFVASGCHESTDHGLSDFGRRLIGEMNRVGMVVDVAHTAYRSTLEAIDLSSSPVIVSHGNIAALNDHPRCYKDDQLKALAARGGVIGITGLGIFLGRNEATPSAYARHVDHVVQLVGPRHVGIGTDYVFDLTALTAQAEGQTDRWPRSGGYQTKNVQQIEPEQLVNVVAEFISLGYSESDVRLILGENWLRIAREVWK